MTSSDAEEFERETPHPLDIVDGLNERLRWSVAIASLISTYDDTDDCIRDSAESIGRHLAEARQIVGKLYDYMGAE